MIDPVETLILDLLEWIRVQPRPYAEVMDAWRTSCPRLPVWEEANDRGFIGCHYQSDLGTSIFVTPEGVTYLNQHRLVDAATLD